MAILFREANALWEICKKLLCSPFFAWHEWLILRPHVYENHASIFLKMWKFRFFSLLKMRKNLNKTLYTVQYVKVKCSYEISSIRVPCLLNVKFWSVSNTELVKYFSFQIKIWTSEIMEYIASLEFFIIWVFSRFLNILLHSCKQSAQFLNPHFLIKSDKILPFLQNLCPKVFGPEVTASKFSCRHCQFCKTNEASFPFLICVQVC